MELKRSWMFVPGHRQSMIDRALASDADLLFLDIFMPGMDGLQAAREIAKRVPHVPILMFTMHMSRELVQEARNAGVQGAVAKSDVTHLIPGLEALLRHEQFFTSPN